MKRLFLSSLVFIVTALPSPYSSAEITLQLDPSFTVSIPKGWDQISKESMASFNNMEQRKGRQYYDFGFKKSKAKNDFDYPYIVIQVKRDVAPTKNDLNKIERASLLSALSKKTPNWLIKNKFYFDQMYNAVFIVADSMEQTGNVIEVVSTGFITKYGYIAVSCYSKKSNIIKNMKYFGDVISSVKISEEYKYDYSEITPPQRPKIKQVYVDRFVEEQKIKKEKNSEMTAALNKGFPAAIFAGILAVIIPSIRHLIRKAKNKKQE